MDWDMMRQKDIYYSGKWSPGDEDNATQNVWSVHVDVEASTGPGMHA